MDSTFKRKGGKLPWRETEERVAQRLGGKRHPHSGGTFKGRTNRFGFKPDIQGDSSTRQLLIESKSTGKASISIKQKWLEKNNADSLMHNKIPALTITFENMDERTEKDWILLPLWFVQDLLKEAENDDSD